MAVVPPKKGPAPVPAKAASKTAAPAKPGNAVAKRDMGALAVSALDEGLSADMILADAQQGHGFQADDLATPFLRIAQTMSPEVNSRDEKHIDGIKVGDFFDTLQRDCFPAVESDGDEGIIVVPVHHEQSYTRWKPRTAGGGLVRDYGTDASVQAQAPYDEQAGKRLFDNGDELVAAHKYFVLLVDPTTGETRKMVFVMAGSNRKIAKKWNSTMAAIKVPLPGATDPDQKFNPPKFYVAYKLLTQYNENDKGNWFEVIEPKPFTATVNLPNGKDIYIEARDFRAMAEAGQVREQVLTEEVVSDAVVEDAEDTV